MHNFWFPLLINAYKPHFINNKLMLSLFLCREGRAMTNLIAREADMEGNSHRSQNKIIVLHDLSCPCFNVFHLNFLPFCLSTSCFFIIIISLCGYIYIFFFRLTDILFYLYLCTLSNWKTEKNRNEKKINKKTYICMNLITHMYEVLHTHLFISM